MASTLKTAQTSATIIHHGPSTRARTVCVRAQAFDNKLVQKPELRRPEPAAAPSPTTTSSPVAEAASTSSSKSAPTGSSSITIEYQRQRAKEMTKYFKELKIQEQVLQTGETFGWTRPNEISNGRWVRTRPF